MELVEYVQKQINEQDNSIRLDLDIVKTMLAKHSLTKAEAQLALSGISGVTFLNDAGLVEIDLLDLYEGTDSADQYFQLPRQELYLLADPLRYFNVNDTETDEGSGAGFTYEAVEGRLTFESAQSGTTTVSIVGLLVDIDGTGTVMYDLWGIYIGNLRKLFNTRGNETEGVAKRLEQHRQLNHGPGTTFRQAP